MSRPNILRGTYVTVLVQTAAGPPAVFEVLCGVTAKSITDQVNTTDTFNRDCADPEDVPVRQISATGRQWSMAAQSLCTWCPMMKSSLRSSPT